MTNDFINGIQTKEKSSTKQISSFSFALILLNIGIFFFAFSASAKEVWDMPMAYSNSNFHSKNGILFAKAVSICTGGELEIKIHAGGSLYAGGQIKRAVKSGQVQIGERLLSAHAKENALYGVDSIPFLVTSYEGSDKLWNITKPLLEKSMAEQNLVLLYSVPWPPQGLYFKKDINSVADMKGIKFRSYNNATARLAELSKMIPVQIEAAELVQALATGVADSFISSGATGYDKKVWEHLSNFYDVQAWLPRNYVFANKKVFDALPNAIKNCLKSSALLAGTTGTARSEQLTGWYLSKLRENGMKVQEPSAKLKNELSGFGQIMTNEWLKQAGKVGTTIINKFNK